MIAVTLLFDLAKAVKKHNGVVELMIEQEKSKGYVPISIDQKPWYTSAEWYDGVITLDGKNVRIVAIMAKYPGHGSFTNMIAGIKREGLRPVVVCPFPKMIKILKRWGWRCRKFGEGFEGEYHWAETWRGQP